VPFRPHVVLGPPDLHFKLFMPVKLRVVKCVHVLAFIDNLTAVILLPTQALGKGNVIEVEAPRIRS